ncbi:MAG TPA: MarR family transcriptional regulator, partial [Solirubrobacteraceae bacterium]
MNAAPPAVDHIAAVLPQQAGRLSRLVLRHARTGLTRSETSALSVLSGGPRRITELAEREGLAQPTMTGLVARLEARDLVTRTRDPHDGRAVQLTLTAEGERVLTELRARYVALLRDCLEAMEPEQVDALVAGGEALEALITQLQRKESV